MTLIETTFETPLGSMIAIADDHYVYLLEFEQSSKLVRHKEKLSLLKQASFIQSSSSILDKLQDEIAAYFKGNNPEFTTPFAEHGTPFQKRVWAELKKVPYGKTSSYKDIACALNMPQAFRAVARANSENPIAIIIPCHRIIRSNGDLSGYAGGVERKPQLLRLENSLTA